MSLKPFSQLDFETFLIFSLLLLLIWKFFFCVLIWYASLLVLVFSDKGTIPSDFSLCYSHQILLSQLSLVMRFNSLVYYSYWSCDDDLFVMMIISNCRNIAQLAKVKIMKKHGDWQDLTIPPRYFQTFFLKWVVIHFNWEMNERGKRQW